MLLATAGQWIKWRKLQSFAPVLRQIGRHQGKALEGASICAQQIDIWSHFRIRAIHKID